MDFLVFKTAHDMDYAINIADVIVIIKTGPITSVPHSPKGVVGMVSFRGNFIAIIDTAELYFNERSSSDLMIVVEALPQPYGILINSVSDVMRGAIPPGVRFVDSKDYVKSVLEFNKDADRIELF